MAHGIGGDYAKLTQARVRRRAQARARGAAGACVWLRPPPWLARGAGGAAAAAVGRVRPRRRARRRGRDAGVRGRGGRPRGGRARPRASCAPCSRRDARPRGGAGLRLPPARAAAVQAEQGERRGDTGEATSPRAPPARLETRARALPPLPSAPRKPPPTAAVVAGAYHHSPFFPNAAFGARRGAGGAKGRAGREIDAEAARGATSKRMRAARAAPAAARARATRHTAAVAFCVFCVAVVFFWGRGRTPRLGRGEGGERGAAGRGTKRGGEGAKGGARRARPRAASRPPGVPRGRACASRAHFFWGGGAGGVRGGAGACRPRWFLRPRPRPPSTHVALPCERRSGGEEEALFTAPLRAARASAPCCRRRSGLNGGRGAPSTRRARALLRALRGLAPAANGAARLALAP